MLGSISLFSQDYIYTRNNNRIAAKDVTIDITEVRYKEFNNPAGSEMAIKSNDISLIAFADGRLQFFEPVKKIVMRNEFNKNLFTYHLADLIVNNFTISYERINKSGKIGFEIPLSLGYGHYAQIDDIVNQFYTGLSVNFYPTGQGKWRFITGPGFRVGSAKWDYYSYDEYGYSNYKSNTGYFKLLVNNGVIFTPIKALSFSIIGSIGVRYVFKMPSDYDQRVRTTGGVSVNLSYRF
ncbi:MAG: hypothetical protein DRJ09_13055 [Bacteroidetes bacterium]|nr:MAG: hypothetical protein DRJ09_13055 [Bacteroidota bacterium]